MDAESKHHQIVARDHSSVEGKHRIREVLEARTAEKKQERKTISQDFQESNIPGNVKHSHSIFKGFIERTFAQINDKLFE